MSFGELLTCVREDIPVTAVVFNNEQWGAEKKNQVDFYANRFEGVNLKNPSWAEVAKTLGAEGIVVKNLGDVGEALEKAVDAQKKGKTTVLEMLVTKELGDPFRRDALKKPKRLLEEIQAHQRGLRRAESTGRWPRRSARSSHLPSAWTMRPGSGMPIPGASTRAWPPRRSSCWRSGAEHGSAGGR